MADTDIRDNKAILVVDDEADIAELLSMALAAEGYAVDVAPNAARALELIRRGCYDAAIVDLQLPDMSGVMLHRELRGLDGRLAEHTVFTSGQARSNGHRESAEARGQAFLAKPFEVGQLLETLGRLWPSRRKTDFP